MVKKKPLVRKACAKCGVVNMVPRNRRHCYERPMGKMGYSCWGSLSMVKPAKKPRQRPQDEAAEKLAHAREMVKQKASAIRRLTTSLNLWQRRATYFAKLASETDAERAARIEARKTRNVERAAERARKRRGIDFTL